MAKGESTQRSQLDAEHLTAHLRQVGSAQLTQEHEKEEKEIWLVADGSDLCKPYAEAMPYLMQVRDEQGKLVPGYRSLTVIGMTPGHRGILYQHKFEQRGTRLFERTRRSANDGFSGENSSSEIFKLTIPPILVHTAWSLISIIEEYRA